MTNKKQVREKIEKVVDHYIVDDDEVQDCIDSLMSQVIDGVFEDGKRIGSAEKSMSIPIRDHIIYRSSKPRNVNVSDALCQDGRFDRDANLNEVVFINRRDAYALAEAFNNSDKSHFYYAQAMCVHAEN